MAQVAIPVATPTGGAAAPGISKADYSAALKSLTTQLRQIYRIKGKVDEVPKGQKVPIPSLGKDLGRGDVDKLFNQALAAIEDLGEAFGAKVKRVPKIKFSLGFRLPIKVKPELLNFLSQVDFGPRDPAAPAGPDNQPLRSYLPFLDPNAQIGGVSIYGITTRGILTSLYTILMYRYNLTANAAVNKNLPPADYQRKWLGLDPAVPAEAALIPFFQTIYQQDLAELQRGDAKKGIPPGTQDGTPKPTLAKKQQTAAKKQQQYVPKYDDYYHAARPDMFSFTDFQKVTKLGTVEMPKGSAEEQQFKATYDLTPNELVAYETVRELELSRATQAELQGAPSMSVDYDLVARRAQGLANYFNANPAAVADLKAKLTAMDLVEAKLPDGTEVTYWPAPAYQLASQYLAAAPEAQPGPHLAIRARLDNEQEMISGALGVYTAQREAAAPKRRQAKVLPGGLGALQQQIAARAPPRRRGGRAAASPVAPLPAVL